jgi:DNA repair exonuclease SbcCD ATPase subunit
MKLYNLSLKYFKGIKDYKLVLNGQDAGIFADNGLGKSTIMDSWCYLLFGKDSLNQADFEIKTLDETGKPYPGLDHEVEGVIEVAGQMLTLRKVYSEVWTKRRNSATKEFTGHKTEHYIDGVTNPRAFNTDLHWQKRRQILLDVCGDISDAQIIASNDKLASLPAILNGHTLDDYRKIIKASQTRINEQLHDIPVRIDEAEKDLPVVDHDDAVAITAKIDKLVQQKALKAEERLLVSSGGGALSKQRVLKAVELEISTLERTHQNDKDAEMWHTKTQLQSVVDDAERIRRSIKSKEDEAKIASSAIIQLEIEIQTLRNRYDLIFASKFEYEDKNICPTCLQSLPQDQVNSAREKALASFNQGRAEKLETIIHNGKEAKTRKETLESNNLKLADEINVINVNLFNLDKKACELNTRLSRHDDSVPAGLVEKQAQKVQIEKEIAELKNGNSGELAKIDTEIAETDARIASLQQTLQKVLQRDLGLRRVEELKAQERDLAKQFEELESQLFLCETFIKTKVKLLTDKINNKFEFVKWKLFETQINGAINEVCVAMVNGVPYDTGLNNGMQICAGLDIIRALQKHYGVQVPVWCDNRESVTKIPEMDCQIISLYVSSKDSKLRVETAGKKEVVNASSR